MGTDTGTPLITWDQLTVGAFKDLVKGYTDPAAQAALLLEGSREVEGMCDRRFMPFTITESHRAEGIDPDEASGDSTIPMDIRSAVSQSYATSLGANNNLARQVWLNEYAPRYSEFWTYSNVTVDVVRSYGGSQTGITLLDGPAVDSGRAWFLLGSYIPVGSQLYVNYSGEYSTVPADLARVTKYIVAALVADELDPFGEEFGHDPDLLRQRAETRAEGYIRP